MTGLSIESLGAFTAVGKNASETMGSLISRVQLFDDLDVLGPGGDPIAGAMTPIPKQVTGVERLLALALYAIDECVSGAPPLARPYPLFLAVPAPPDLTEGQAATLLARLAAEGALRIDLESSRVIARGRESVPLALAEARKRLLSRASPACLVAGVDSFVETARVRRLMAAGRVRDGSNIDGFTPGEAAGCLLLSAAAAHGPVAVLAGLGFAEEPGSWTGEPPVTGKGLGRAFVAAISEAAIGGADLGYIAHDVSGEHAVFEELSLAFGRLPPRAPDQAEIWGPATCTGEIGAAAGVISLAMLAFYVKQGVLTRPALASFVSEGRLRAAAVVTPRADGKR
jgi:3-oxoacyl-[acyl-carrier-protein] synthase I